MTAAPVVVSVIVGLMLAEYRVSARHERILRAAGAEAPREPQYPLMAASYPLVFLLMGGEAVWRHTEGGPWSVSGVLLFAASKALKYWAIGALGERWTFRVFVLPRVPLVRSGPYAYVAHPNYIAVAGELAGAGMMLGAVLTGPIATVLFCGLMWRRARFEADVLRPAIR